METINIAWDLVGKIAVIIGTTVAIVQGFKYLRSQTSLAKLEDKVEKQSEILEKDYKHLEAIDDRMNGFERRINDFEELQERQSRKVNESLERLGGSMAQILNHLIDGGNTDEMKKERDKLVSFFIEGQKRS